MKLSNKAKFASVFAALASGLFMSGSALAIGGGGGADCSVSRDTGLGSVFYVPSGGSGNYNILGWGNGTGGTSGTYRGLLESVAEQCILVAAATTANSGDGRDVERAVNDAKSRYRNIVGSDPKVCTSGHSQGGGGSFNAANRLDADCVIAVQSSRSASCSSAFLLLRVADLPRDADSWRGRVAACCSASPGASWHSHIRSIGRVEKNAL